MQDLIENNTEYKFELFVLYVSTFLLRTGFGGSILLFDWTLVWAIENSLGVDQTASVSAILLISFSAISYYIAEIFMTGYYGGRSDKIGAKPVILFATIGAGIILLLYGPASIVFIQFLDNGLIFALLIMTLYITLIHFLHGVFASAKVAPSLGFINQYSTDSNRALHMAWYDNAILYGRAAGIMLGGFLWILLGVDNHTSNIDEQAGLIAKTYPFLSILLIIASLMIYFGLKNIPAKENPKPFSFKEDITIAAKVMLKENRRPMLLPWISIAALLGSASLWGPTVSFIISAEEETTHRGIDALLPIMVILIALALPAPLWGMFADRKGRKLTLLVGLFGLPITGILGLAIGFPFYRNDISISNINFLLSLVPAAMVFSSLIPVLMGLLGDTAEVAHDGEVMSGYHFVIATGEIIGVLAGGLVIGLFSGIQQFSGIFGSGQKGNGIAILIGFILFEIILVIGMVIGIIRLPDTHEPKKELVDDAVDIFES